MNNNKVALITGASAGIGKATALKFAEQGYRTVICDVDEEHLEKVAEEIRKCGNECLSVPCDISDASEALSLIEQTISTFGQLDAACNNAGIEGKSALTVDCTIEEWNRVLGVNLRGQWLCMKSEIPHMLERGGSIINMTSILGTVAFAQAPGYTAAKHGLIGLTKAAALDYADKKIRVNVVCPGFIETPMLDRAGITTDPETKKAVVSMHPLGRMGTPEEIANAVVWLASDESSFVTGHALLVASGYVAR